MKISAILYVSLALVAPLGASRLSGTVRSLVTQEALPGVKVVYTNEQQGDVYRETTTNSLGQFDLDGLPEGVADISARPLPEVMFGGRYYASCEKRINIKPDEHRKYFPLMVEEGALISGHVRDVSASPVSGEEIQASSEKGEEQEWCRSGAGGDYAMRLPPGRHTLSLDSNHENTALPHLIDVNSPVDHQSFDFTTYAAGGGVQIRGAIMNPGGHPVRPGAELAVFAMLQGPTWITIDNFNLPRQISSHFGLSFGGSYSLEVPPNTDYHVIFAIFSDSGIVFRSSIPVTTGPANSLSPNHNFGYDSEGGTISGSVTVDGAPAYSGKVVLFDSSGTMAGLVKQLDGNGAYAFHNVPAGNYTVQARHWEYGKSLPVAVNGLADGGAVHEIDLRIETEGVPSGIQTSADSTAQLSFDSIHGQEYRIESSTELENWATVALITGDGSLVNWTDQHAVEPSKFYRVLLVR